MRPERFRPFIAEALAKAPDVRTVEPSGWPQYWAACHLFDRCAAVDRRHLCCRRQKV